MTELYEAYLAAGHPPLPEGYSFHVHASRHLPHISVSIVGPPRGVLKRRRAEFINKGLDGCTFMWPVDRVEDGPTVTLVSLLSTVRQIWEDVSLARESKDRWFAHDGMHP